MKSSPLFPSCQRPRPAVTTVASTIMYHYISSFDLIQVYYDLSLITITWLQYFSASRDLTLYGKALWVYYLESAVMRKSFIIHYLCKYWLLWDENIRSYMLRHLKLISQTEDLRFRPLLQWKFGDKFQPKKEVCKTIIFQILLYLSESSSTARCITLDVSNSILTVYSSLQTLSLGARVLIIKWKTSSQWQLVEYKVYFGTPDSRCFLSECT